MGEWDRRTPWRQGEVIATASAEALGLTSPGATESTVTIVISHDCDLAQPPEVEPCIEVIVGRLVERLDGNLTHAKNPRRLHLVLREGEGERFIELAATAKQLVAKSGLSARVPDERYRLLPREQSVLQRWLAARYRRAAFPDEFERRLEAARLDDAIAKIVRPLGKDVIAVFFDVDEGRSLVRSGEEDAYTLSIDLLYSSAEDPVAAERRVATASERIGEAFERTLASGGKWRDIELLGCQAVSDEALTYAMSVQLKKWNMDYLSLREDPQTMVLAD